VDRAFSGTSRIAANAGRRARVSTPRFDLRQTDSLTAREASGISSYWDGDLPPDVQKSKSRNARLIAKRAVDIGAASAALLFLLPLLLFVALAIKVSDPGPALFRQTRLGKDGQRFTIFKFRSMYLSACSKDGVTQTVDHDPRVMPVGAFIRKTSIDELPQLLNVLFGDMSLVGPRPHVEGQLAEGKQYGEVIPYYSYRLGMRPGLTGWAQANGYRGPTDNMTRARLRIEHDVAYIQNFSLLLDLRIVVLTLRREFLGGTGF
jgi:lipopolysaccharide/colanic/teichoic acid biosynthesis glycosyltransferase